MRELHRLLGIAGGKRVGGDKDAFDTAIREMLEETSGERRLRCLSLPQRSTCVCITDCNGPTLSTLPACLSFIIHMLGASCGAGLLSPADLIEDSTVIWCPHGLYAVYPKQVRPANRGCDVSSAR